MPVIPLHEFWIFEKQADQATEMSGVFRRSFELELELNQESRDSGAEPVELKDALDARDELLLQRKR